MVSNEATSNEATSNESTNQVGGEVGGVEGAGTGRAPLLEVRDLTVTFSRKRLFQEPVRVRAVDGVSFDLAEGETLGLVGESGCGKSTTARGIMRLVEPERGSVRIAGTELLGLPAKELRAVRRNIQMVFQDPYSSLDPSMLVRDSVGEPLDVHFKLDRDEKHQRVAELFERVGLSPDHMYRYPHEFSGGQRQRLTIARAIAAEPRILLCDEAVSALDVSTQNQIIKLLKQLSAQSQLAYVFISHDLSVVRHISDRVAVMYLGHIIEHGDTARVFEHPAHPYTEALLSAVPIPSPSVQRNRDHIVLSGDPPDPSHIPPGCRFHTRCPHVMDVCRTEAPEPTPVLGSGEVRCHLHTSGPRLQGASVRDLHVRPAGAASTVR